MDKRERRLRKLALKLTEYLVYETRNSAEYMTVLTSSLGSAIAALARNKNDEEFEGMLKESLVVIAMSARGGREQLQQEEASVH